MAPEVSPVADSAYDKRKRKSFALPPELGASFATIFTQVRTSFAQIQTKPEGIRDAVRSELKSPNHMRIGEIASEELRTLTGKKDIKKSSTVPTGRSETDLIVREPKSKIQHNIVEDKTIVGKVVERDKREKGGTMISSTVPRTSKPSSHMPVPARNAVERSESREGQQIRSATNEVRKGYSNESATKFGIAKIVFAKNNRSSSSKSIEAKGASIYRTKSSDVPAQVSRALAKIISQGGGRTILRLNPKLLGKIRVDVHLKMGVASARLHAEQQQTRELMLSHVDSLRTNLEKSGIIVERLEIAEMDTQTGSLDSDAERQRDEGTKEQSYQQTSTNIKSDSNTSSQDSKIGGGHDADKDQFSSSSESEVMVGTREIRLDTVA